MQPERGRSFIVPAFEIDLHRGIQPFHRGAALSEEFLFADSSKIVVAGIDVDALSPNGVFLHACLHMTVGYGANCRRWRT